MTTIFLIRHAAHDLVGRAIVGRMPGVHLSRAGRQQAEKVAERLAQESLSAVYSSPLARARETAEPLARRLRLEMQIAEDFNEIDYGEWTGRTLDELAEVEQWRLYNTFRAGSRIPGGELMVEAQTRAVAKLAWVQRRHPADRVAVVSHGDIIKSILAFYLGISLDLFQRIAIDPASLSILTLSEYDPQVLRMNEPIGE